MINILRAIVIIVVAGLLSSVAIFRVNGAVVADFSGGNGSTLPDQYVGATGAGWSSAWSAGSAISGSVTNTSPLSGGGNYLSVGLTSTPGSVTYLNRTWSNTDVSYTGNVALSWTFRLDSSLTSFDSQSDVIHFYDGLGAGASFMVSGFGASTGSAVGQTWAFYNGSRDGASWNGGNYVNTGIAIIPDTVYTFSIALDPSTRSWVGTVSNGTASFTSSALGFRTSAYSASGTFTMGMQEEISSNNLTASLDSLSIVPEVRISLLVALGVIFFLGKKRFQITNQ